MWPTNDPDLDRLAFEFFKLFARYEYALKAAGYHTGEGAAKADWDKFAAVVNPVFTNIQNLELKEAVEYMLGEPPKKQYVENGLLEWKISRANGNTARKLLMYVRRVRNNLFHGGKFNGHWFAPERSEILLRHSIKILEECLKATVDVQEAFNS